MPNIEELCVAQSDISLRTVSSIWHTAAGGLPRIQAKQLGVAVQRDVDCVRVTLFDSNRLCGFFEVDRPGCVHLLEMSETLSSLVFRGDRSTFTIPAEEIFGILEETSQDLVRSSIAVRFDAAHPPSALSVEAIPEFACS